MNGLIPFERITEVITKTMTSTLRASKGEESYKLPRAAATLLLNTSPSTTGVFGRKSAVSNRTRSGVVAIWKSNEPKSYT